MATALQSLISLAFLFFLVFFLVNQHRVDRLRQKLFFIRDALFDEAAAGRISFDSKAYGYTRTVLNGFLRFSHRLSVSRLATVSVLVRRADLDETNETLRAAMSASSEADRALCEEYLKMAHEAVVKHLASAPISVILMIPVLSLVLTWACSMSLFTWALKHCKAHFVRLDIAAYAEGKAMASVATNSFSHSRYA